MTEPLRSTIQLPRGPITVLHQAGSGGSSEVWAVRRRTRQYALKVAHAAASQVVASEAQRLALACSPNLPSVLEVGRLPDSLPLNHAWRNAPYLLLSWTRGETLSQVLRQPLPESEKTALAVAVARDIGSALSDLHEAGVAHGDVKPDNVLVERVSNDGCSGLRCTLIDLGLAAEAFAPELTGATLRYLPPEYRDPRRYGCGQEPTDGRSRDLWALGLTLLEVFVPQPSGTLEPDTSTVPVALRPIIAALLTPSASARPRARWVAEQAGYQTTSTHGQLTIRRRYLASQWQFLNQVATGNAYEIGVTGKPGQWLNAACHILTCIPDLNGATCSITSDATTAARSLDSEQQRKLLIQLCGLVGIDLPPLPPLPDDVLIGRLLRVIKRRPLESLSLGELSRLVVPEADDGAASELSRAASAREAEQDGAHGGYGARTAVDVSQADLALELGAERPSEGVLALAEHAVFSGTASLSFTLRLSRSLKRLGELGRARAILLTRPEPIAALEMAAVLARAGATDVALEHAAELSKLPALGDEARSSAAALLARLHLARGDSTGAVRALADHVVTAESLEAQASIALVCAEPERARALLARASGLARDREQQARIESLTAHLDHQVGDHARALQGFQRAVEYAARAGAVLEEATYLVGIASTAAHLAQSDEALRAAERAQALFQFLHNPAASARALLSRASTLSLLGAQVEARSAALATVTQAQSARDARCEAFAHLLLSELDVPDQQLAHIGHARRLLEPLTLTDSLRLAAGRLRCSDLEPRERAEYDERARSELDLEVRLEWWAARASKLLVDGAGPDQSGHGDGEAVLSALGPLVTSAGPVDVVGRAFAGAAELAARAGDGDRCLRFVSIAKAAHNRIVDGAPQALKLSARQLPWAKWVARNNTATSLRGEQIVEVERLVQNLADRSRLRPVLDRTLDALVRWTGVERGLLLLKAPEGRLVPRAARNLARRDLTSEQLELSQSLAQQALNSGDCVVAVDATGELSTVHHSVHALRLRSVLAVPLAAHGETLGVVYLDDRRRRGAFGDAELSWVRLVASIASVAIADARDQTVLRRAVRRAQRAERRLVEHLAQTQTELSQVKAALESQTSGPDSHPTLVGSSIELRTLKRLIDRVAASDIPVLVAGESGTGKELVARAIHNSGARKDRIFVSENCSAIPETLLESTLFGHQKGAFTGATQNHVGLFELAHQGTLFLDELGEMSLPMQAKLLRVLETGELRRVGGERTLRVDVRVLGASHKDLASLVEHGLFREDLYYRLNVVTIRVPPLRKRTDDIPELISHFLAKHDRAGKTVVTAEALAVLQLFAWPGNVRQLENEIRRAIVLCDGRITPEHLSAPVRGSVGLLPDPATPLNLRQHVDALEVRLIKQALSNTSGNQTRAAEALGISRFGLQKMLKRLNIALPQ